MTDYTYYRDVFGGRYGTEIVPYLRRAYTVIRACITVTKLRWVTVRRGVLYLPIHVVGRIEHIAQIKF